MTKKCKLLFIVTIFCSFISYVMPPSEFLARRWLDGNRYFEEWQSRNDEQSPYYMETFTMLFSDVKAARIGFCNECKEVDLEPDAYMKYVEDRVKEQKDFDASGVALF